MSEIGRILINGKEMQLPKDYELPKKRGIVLAKYNKGTWTYFNLNKYFK